MLLESSVEDAHTVRLDVENFPSGWSYNYKDENGATVTEVTLASGESKGLDLQVTVGSQASYNEAGYSFKAVASAITDSNLVGRQPIEVFLKLTEGFTFSSLKYKQEMGPGDSYTFQLNIVNNANGDDSFTLSATYPSGWRVVFPDGSTVDVPAGSSRTISIQITASDESRDGDTETIEVSIRSELTKEVQKQNFVVEVQQGFTDKLVTAFSDLWYIFAFLGLILAVGFVTYSRRDEDDWEYDDEDEEDESPQPQVNEADDDWDAWN